jgi:hypothetical protein
MKGDENLAEVQLSCSFFDARTGGRVADRVNRKGEAFDRAGGLLGLGRRLEYATSFSGFAAGCLRDTKPGENTNCVSGLFDGGLTMREAFQAACRLALSWGSQSWLQPAFSRLPRHMANSSGFAA